MNKVLFAVAVPMWMASGTVAAQERIDLEGTSIIGNKELPKVLYIVPWKSAPVGDLVSRPVESLLDEALAPLDRDVFRRQVEYYEMLKKR